MPKFALPVIGKDLLRQEVSKSGIVSNGSKVVVYNFLLKHPIPLDKAEKFLNEFCKGVIGVSGKKYLVNFSVQTNYGPRGLDSFQPIQKRLHIQTLDQTYDAPFLANAVEEAHNIQIYLQPLKAGGDDLHNRDCLFNAISCGVNGNFFLLPEEIRYAKDLKLFLGLNRRDPVPADCIEKIDSIIKTFRLNCVGDFEYVSSKILDSKYQHLSITVLLRNGHYSFVCNKDRAATKGVFFEEKEPFQLIIDDKGFHVKTMDGVIRDLSEKEYQETKYSRLYITYPIEEYAAHANALKEATNGTIKLLKYRSYKLAALDIWRMHSRSYTGADPIAYEEQKYLSLALTKGLAYAQLYEGPGYSYDGNSWYPAMAASQYFNFPIKPGKFIHMTNEEFQNPYNRKYGIYHCIINGQDKSSAPLFNIQSKGWYCHYDLMTAFELGYKVELVEFADDGQQVINVLKYDKETLVRGYDVFRPFVRYMYDLKRKGVPGAKQILNSLFGALGENTVRSYKVHLKEDDFIVDDAKVLMKISGESSCADVQIRDAANIFKSNEARMLPFLHSFARRNLYRVIKPYVNSVVRVNTDGFVSTKKLNISLSQNLGEFKLEKSGHCVVKAYNQVRFT